MLWDLGGVLVDVDLDRARVQWQRETGLAASAFDRVFLESSLKHDMDRGRAAVDTIVAAVEAAVGRPLGPGRVARIWNAAISARPGIIGRVREVAGRARVGVISNTDPFHARHIQSFPLLAEVVEGWTFSCAVGVAKPAPEIFRASLDQLGVAAGEAVLVDDHLDNVEAALSLGLDAIHYTEPSQLDVELSLRGLLGELAHGD